MLEQVYELNLPPFNDICIKDHQFENYNYSGSNISEIIDMEKLKSCLTNINFEFERFYYFRKINKAGWIHIDHTFIDGNLKHCVWGINWIFDGTGFIEYWNFDKVEYQLTQQMKSEDVRTFKAHCASENKYWLSKNKVYLVNATLPHRAYGFGDRKAFSLRVKINQTDYWSDIVEKFRPLIIT